MKYTLLINQAGIVQSGLHIQTDLVDWALLEYISDWQVHGRAYRLNDHVWLNYSHLVDEMPLLGLNKKNSVSNRIKKLIQLGLITTVHDQDKRVYVKTTDYFNDICRFRPNQSVCVEQETPNKQSKPVGLCVPHKEQGVPHQEQGVPHQEQGVPHQEHTINNQLINNQEYKKTTTPSGVVGKKTETKLGKRFDLETMPDIWRQFCHDERPRLDPDTVFARFRDYWIAQPGAKGRKLDWCATWRNWVRNETVRFENGPHQQSGQHRKLSAVELVQQASQRYADAEQQRYRNEKIVGQSN